MAQYVKLTSPDGYRAKEILDATSHGEAVRLETLMRDTALSINLAVAGAYDGATPLHIAARKRQVEIVRWIRDKRGERNMNVQIESGFTPLHAVIADSDEVPSPDPLITHYASPEQVVKELLLTGTSTIPVSIEVMLCIIVCINLLLTILIVEQHDVSLQSPNNSRPIPSVTFASSFCYSAET